MQASREIFSFSKKNTQVYITPNKVDLTTDVDSIHLQDEEKEKYVALKSEKRKKEFLLIRFLRNQLFPNKEIGYLDSGAPFIKDNILSISISHTTSYVAMAISTESRIGLDLEEVQSKIIRLGPKFMHPNELKEADKKNIAKSYTCYWCGKEALYKWSGIEGLSFQNDLPIYHKNHSIWEGKSVRISNDPISLEMITFENHILCFTY